MKKYLAKALFIVVLCVCLFMVLNMEVQTRQGIDYQVRTIKIPLYLKLLDFIDRHYNYEQLVRRIIKDEPNSKEKVLKIFSWTYENIRKQPQGLPAIDDHVWHVIIRGYGINDQFCDVFSTLCNYAKISAFYIWVYNNDKTYRIPLSFVSIEGEWFIFDPYNGVYFVDSAGRLANISAIKDEDYHLMCLDDSGKDVFDYKSYINGIDNIVDVGLKREKIQSPYKRLLYEVKKWIK